MEKKVLSEKEAKEKIAKLEEEYGVKFTKSQKRKTIEKYMGKRKWFD